MIILNLTQHIGTPEQDVIEPENKAQVQKLLTFSNIPSKKEIATRASALANLAAYHRDCSHDGDHEPFAAMIGGAPYLMSALERALKAVNIQPGYAFSTRKSIEKVINGKIVKTSTFDHAGWIEV